MEVNGSVSQATTQFNCGSFIVTPFYVNMICFTFPSSDEMTFAKKHLN